LKIAKSKPEAVRRRRTTNTITKRKRTNNDTENSKIYGNNEHFKTSANLEAVKAYTYLVDSYRISVSQMTTDMFHL